jgi:hypothetical protein
MIRLLTLNAFRRNFRLLEMTALDALPPSRLSHLIHVHPQLPHHRRVRWKVTRQQHYSVVTAYWHKPQHKHIAASTGVALQHSITKGAILVELDHATAGLDLS